MRAKLASKKKYDPKNESVDLKKKFDIIQKLWDEKGSPTNYLL